MTSSSNSSIDPKINQHIQMMTGDPTAYREWAKTVGTKPITPDLIPDSIRQIYIKQAKNQLHPWFQNEMNYGAKNLGNTMEQTQLDYQNTIDQLNQGLKADVEDLTNKSASAGAFGSTAWQKAQESLAGKYQNKYQNAYNSAYGNTQNALTRGEYTYGSDMALNNLPKITQYNVSPTAQVSQGQTAKYNPFGGQGTLNVGMQSQANTLAGDYLGALIKNPNYQVRK